MIALRAVLIWAALAVAVTAPTVIAARSEYLAYRDAIYIAAGLAGVIALAALLVQPLLAGGLLPGVSPVAAQRLHRAVGAALVLAVAVHVAGLWVTSPPDMIDALTFSAPTAFSVFGVVAMWALIAAALLGAFRRRLPLRPQVWRLAHSSAVGVVVAGSIAHALLIEGTMGPLSKAALCLLTAGALLVVVWRRQPWRGVRRARATVARD